MFTSRSPYYDRNIEDGKRLTIRQALITDPDGNHINAVALFNGLHMKFCIPANDAIRLANDIADAVEAHENRTAA
jgi:hypothetical protein